MLVLVHALAGLLVLTLAGTPSAAAPRDRTPRLPVRFTVMPDFLNADVGDLRQAPGWEEGDPNGISPSWRTALDTVLSTVGADSPDFVLVPGDLVGGEWGEDVDGSGFFGPVTTFAEQVQAAMAAADLYYRQWRLRFGRHGLQVHAAVGDHEIGDNPWGPQFLRTAMFDELKHAWAEKFTHTDGGVPRYRYFPAGSPWEETAYAFRRGDMLFVTVDVWKRTPEGGVVADVVGRQLRWLDRLLAQQRRQGARWIVVQGHTPVLAPVRLFRSSNITLEAGANSAFWRVLRKHGVNLYLSGEAHAPTARTDGVLQVTTGSLLFRGRYDYLRVVAGADRMRLVLRRFRSTFPEPDDLLWTTTRQPVPSLIELDPVPRTIGRATVVRRRDGSQRVVDRSGYLREYTG